jgi:hypothetical protein
MSHAFSSSTSSFLLPSSQTKPMKEKMMITSYLKPTTKEPHSHTNNIITFGGNKKQTKPKYKTKSKPNQTQTKIQIKPKPNPNQNTKPTTKNQIKLSFI